MTIFWFRRDLRLDDNCGLFHALTQNADVVPVFIFDTEILSKLVQTDDARVNFIYSEIQSMKQQLEKAGTTLLVYYGRPLDVFKKIISEFRVTKVVANEDYEPYAIRRDSEIAGFLKQNQIETEFYKDHVLFAKNEVLKSDVKPYTIFTPYMNQWKRQFNATSLATFNTNNFFGSFRKMPPSGLISLDEMGFRYGVYTFPSRVPDLEIIKNYHLTRDIPSVEGTSKLSLHLRFGTISIRSVFKMAVENNEKWLNELIWREFYQMILFHFPESENRSFKPQYRNLAWENDEKIFKAWCEGKTGFPIVDAGMRELVVTGYMHNRVRMITASFLTRLLLTDWKWGEQFFATHLLDFELASNVGSWQWAAGTGCDAVPYFRIFNPAEQTRKFDPEYKYIKKWIPGFDEKNYIKPIIDYKAARERAILRFKSCLANY